MSSLTSRSLSHKTAVRFGDTPEEIEADEVSGNFFPRFGVPMAIGQPFPAEMKTSIRSPPSSATAIGRAASTATPALLASRSSSMAFLSPLPAWPLHASTGSNPAGAVTDLWLPLQNQPELNAWGVPATTDEYPLRQPQLVEPDADGAPQGRRHRRNRPSPRPRPLFAHAVYETAGTEDKKKPIKIELLALPPAASAPRPKTTSNPSAF